MDVLVSILSVLSLFSKDCALHFRILPIVVKGQLM